MGTPLLFAGVLLLWCSDFTVALIKEWPITDLQRRTPTPSSSRSNSVPFSTIVDPPYHAAGYIHPNNTREVELFYFYFQERNKDPDAPLLFWTNGGPGCSSMVTLFTSNGPYRLQEDLTLEWNEFGWDVGQNIIFVDQPAGAGFSYSGVERDYVHDEAGVAADMLMFFVEFLELHPELRGKDFYLSGVGYAGHSLPAIAASIHKNSGLLDLKLKGVLMGNPMTNPLSMMLSYPNFAQANGLISKDWADWMRLRRDECILLDKRCQLLKFESACLDAGDVCTRINWDPIVAANPGIDIDDIRKKCVGGSCYPYLLHRFLNNPEVKKILGVHRYWEECSYEVVYKMVGHIDINMGGTVRELLNDGIRFIVYAGDQDLISNWMGNKDWLDNMSWDKYSDWKGELRKWEFASKSGKAVTPGECEVLEPLTFCKVFQAGSMVPKDQPEAAFDLVHRFIDEGKFVQSDVPTSFHRFNFSQQRKIVVT